MDVGPDVAPRHELPTSEDPSSRSRTRVRWDSGVPPTDPFGRTALPLSHLTPERRVGLLAQAATALLGDEPVPAEARLLLGGALARYLSEGGALDKHLGVRPRRGSRMTPAAIQRRLVVRSEADAPRDEPTESRRFVVASSR